LQGATACSISETHTPMTTTSQLRSRIESSPLYNEDLAPASAERRHWGTYNFAALWISMSVNILTYMLAASLIQGGMNWKQAVATIFLGNVIVLAPMLLNSHPGAKYGIPFPVLARASFGVLGANIAAVLRALVACGWFGIQAWIGGEAISTLLATLAPGLKNFPYGPAICFFLFWLINLAVVLKGIEYIRVLQGISAPVLLGVGLLLLGWAYHAAGGFGPMFSVPSRFNTFPDFLKFLIPALNGTVGFWATVSLNIPDFTRFARNQREQVIGQALALPTTMTLYAFVGIVVTSATVVIYGTAIWDPVQLLSRFHSPAAVVISLVAILLATLNVNIGANVVSPANNFFQPVAAWDQFPHRRHHHLFHGGRADAVEAALQLQNIYSRLAGRLRGLSRARGRNHDLRLLRHPAESVAG
jgi:NCS1 family nucleobase:cation symporter-1